MHHAGSARAVLFVFATLLASLAAEAGEVTPEQRLMRMDSALRTLDFQGSFVYQHDGRVDALRIFHLGGAHERERLVSLTGPRGEIVRDHGTITCVTSGAAPTLFASSEALRLLPLVPNIRALGPQYSVSESGEDRVAGYDARVIDISPRDQYRYGYRLWLEQNSELLLRSAVLDAAQRTLEQFMFVALDVGAKPSESDLDPGSDAGTAVSPTDEVRIDTRPRWTVASAPRGFRLVRTQRSNKDTSGAEHLVYSDGIASVSVYVEPHAGSGSASTEESTVRRGVLSIDSRSENGLRVTAVGNVPPATVQAMARAVRANDAK